MEKKKKIIPHVLWIFLIVVVAIVAAGKGFELYSQEKPASPKSPTGYSIESSSFDPNDDPEVTIESNIYNATLSLGTINSTLSPNAMLTEDYVTWPVIHSWVNTSVFNYLCDGTIWDPAGAPPYTFSMNCSGTSDYTWRLFIQRYGGDASTLPAIKKILKAEFHILKTTGAIPATSILNESILQIKSQTYYPEILACEIFAGTGTYVATASSPSLNYLYHYLRRGASGCCVDSYLENSQIGSMHIFRLQDYAESFTTNYVQYWEPSATNTFKVIHDPGPSAWVLIGNGISYSPGSYICDFMRNYKAAPKTRQAVKWAEPATVQENRTLTIGVKFRLPSGWSNVNFTDKYPNNFTFQSLEVRKYNDTQLVGNQSVSPTLVDEGIYKKFTITETAPGTLSLFNATEAEWTEVAYVLRAPVGVGVVGFPAANVSYI